MVILARFEAVVGFVMLIMALMAVMPSASAVVTSPILDIVLSDQSPNPVSPGGTVTIEIEVQNLGYGEAEDRTIEIMPKEPFTLLPGEEKVNTITRIPGRDSHSITYRLKVSSAALTNTYPVEFRIYSGTVRDDYVTDTLDISIQGDPNLVIDELYTVPADLEPGTIADIIVKIKNIGTGNANELQLSLNSTYDEIRPVLAKGKVFVGDIEPGETQKATLSMSVDSSAEEKTYTVLLYADYKEEDNTAGTSSFSVGLPVKGSINLDIINKEPNYNRNTLKVEVANKGTTEAKSLEAKLVIDGETVGIDYISTLKANKKTTFDFPLVLEGSGQIVFNYIGPGIEKNQAAKDIVLSYEKPASGDGTAMLIAIVIIIVIIYLFYRKFIRKKRSKD